MSKPLPIVLVPGLLCTERLWRDQLTALADLGCPVVTTAQAEHNSLARIATEILARAPGSFALAGLSFGGYVAFEILRRAPERVERLALLNTQARADDDATRALREDQIRLAGEGRFLGMSEQLVRSFLHPDRARDQALVADVQAMATAIGREGFVRQQTAIAGRPDSRALLPQIACPTLVLTGRQDGRTPVDLHEEMAELIPDSELEVIADCGHLSPMERPAEVNMAMRRWLEW
jgi:pimeloyl-ACP methyl ester carboxylesterase